MSEFLLLHDNESGGEPATVRKSIISSVLPSDAIYSADDPRYRQSAHQYCALSPPEWRQK